MIRKLSIVLLFLFVVFSVGAVNEVDTTKIEKAQRYSNYAYNTYLILLGMLALGIIVTLVMIASHYGLSSLRNVLIGIGIAILFIYVLIFWI